MANEPKTTVPELILNKEQLKAWASKSEVKTALLTDPNGKTHQVYRTKLEPATAEDFRKTFLGEQDPSRPRSFYETREPTYKTLMFVQPQQWVYYLRPGDPIGIDPRTGAYNPYIRGGRETLIGHVMGLRALTYLGHSAIEVEVRLTSEAMLPEVVMPRINEQERRRIELEHERELLRLKLIYHSTPNMTVPLEVKAEAFNVEKMSPLPPMPPPPVLPEGQTTQLPKRKLERL